MKVALVGYGKMGQMVESLAPQHDVEITARFWDEHPMLDNKQTRDEIKDAEVLIDFSIPESVVENIRLGTLFKKYMVIGTTGWFDQLDSIRPLIIEQDLGLVYASNFSLGVNLFYRIIQQASRLISSFGEYEPFMEESHHQFKKDSPSGTALVLKKYITDIYERDVPVTSVRAGYIPGTHSIQFDSEVDTISLTHTARNRQGFAQGALIAAKWIVNKKGVFAFEDVVDDLLKTR